MMESSAEYRAMIDLTSELRLAVRLELISLTGSLLASRLISPDNDIELRDTAHSGEVERSARLVELVQNKVRQNPRHYHSFIGILQGNKDQYGDILQQLEQAYQEQQQDGAMEKGVDKDLISRIHDLERQFRQIHENLLTELEDKNVCIKKLLRSLTLLPTEIRVDYMKAITEKFPDLRRESTISDLFYHLSPLVDFLSYGLLKYIIDEFGSNTLKKKMVSYSDDVLVFMKKTTVKQLMSVWPGQQEIPPTFSKLRAKIDENPSTYTLYDLDQLRKRFCSGVKLSDIVLVLIGLETSNSFIAEWLIPSALIPRLMESARMLDYGFYLQKRILKMSVDEKQIFPMLPDAKPKAPALQAAAATATELVEDEPNPEQPDTSLSSSVKQLSLSPTQQREVQEFRYELGDYELYSGVGVIWDLIRSWQPVKLFLSSLDYKIVDNFPAHIEAATSISTIAQSIAPPQPHASPTAAESSDSPPFVIAVFISGILLSSQLLNIRGKEVDIIDDIIQPFLPQSAPHLQHVPKLFFITAQHPVGPRAPPPRFPEDPDGNYCIAYHIIMARAYFWHKISSIADTRALMREWAEDITSNLFIPGMTVQEAIEKSGSHLNKVEENLYYSICLKKNLILKK